MKRVVVPAAIVFCILSGIVAHSEDLASEGVLTIKWDEFPNQPKSTQLLPEFSSEASAEMTAAASSEPGLSGFAPVAPIPQPSKPHIDPSAKRRVEIAPISDQELCGTLIQSAQTNGVPIAFFSNLIWQESQFDLGSVSPAGAMGVAQFMPGTAGEVGLRDPFDPHQALPASAKLLRALSDRFGNFGLAAAAYNAGPRRVLNWLSRRAQLPTETRAYVRIVTGRSANEWRSAGSQQEDFRVTGNLPCRNMPGFEMLKPMETANQAALSDSGRSPAPFYWKRKLQLEHSPVAEAKLSSRHSAGQTKLARTESASGKGSKVHRRDTVERKVTVARLPQIEGHKGTVKKRQA